MQYVLKDGVLQKEIKEVDLDKHEIVITTQEIFLNRLEKPSHLYHICEHIFLNQSLRFESHEMMDVLCLHIHGQDDEEQVPLYIFYQKQHLWMICTQLALVEQSMCQLSAYDMHDWTLEKVLHHYLDLFLSQEARHLDDLQDDILKLEDEVIEEHGNEHTTRTIMNLRKLLLRQERNFDQMQDILDHILMNENALFSDTMLRSFHIMDSRIDRMAGRVSSLQDYVTEIREAYQAEVDIKLNVTMKIFTVITAVFLPLSLIAGWYGMNLKMPEYEWVFAYPLIIVVSILIVLGLLWYFKKNRWF